MLYSKIFLKINIGFFYMEPLSMKRLTETFIEWIAYKAGLKIVSLNNILWIFGMNKELG